MLHLMKDVNEKLEVLGGICTLEQDICFQMKQLANAHIETFKTKTMMNLFIAMELIMLKIALAKTIM